MSNFNSMQTVYGGLYLNTVNPYVYYFPMNATETGACSVFTAHMPKFCPRNCSISSNVHAPQLSSISNCSDIVFFCFILSFKAIHIIVMDFVITAWHLFLEKHQPEVAQSNSCLPLSCCNRMWLFKVTDWLKELEQYPQTNGSLFPGCQIDCADAMAVGPGYWCLCGANLNFEPMNRDSLRVRSGHLRRESCYRFFSVCLWVNSCDSASVEYSGYSRQNSTYVSNQVPLSEAGVDENSFRQLTFWQTRKDYRDWKEEREEDWERKSPQHLWLAVDDHSQSFPREEKQQWLDRGANRHLTRNKKGNES